MSTPARKVGFSSIFMIFMLFNGLLSHVIINPILLDASGRDAWISVLLTAVIFIPWCAMLAFIINRSGRQKFQVWLASKTSPFLAWIMLTPLIIQLYLIGGMTVFQTSLWTVSNYMPATPPYVLVTVLVLVCYYASKKGLNVIAVCSGILLPAVVLLGYFVSIANIPEKNWELLRPVLEHGWGNPISGMVYLGGAFSEIFLILLLQHRIKKKVRAWQMMLLGVVLVYITLGPLVGAITEFGPIEAAKQMVSPYEQWRLVKLGNYIEHVDFLSVFQWLAGAAIRISLAQYLLADLLPIKQEKLRNRVVLLLSLSFVATSLWATYNIPFYLTMFEQYLIISCCVTAVLSIIWFMIACFSKPVHAKEGQTE